MRYKGHISNFQCFRCVSIVYLCFATQLHLSELARGPGGLQYISEQMKHPVTYQQFDSCATNIYCSLFHF